MLIIMQQLLSYPLRMNQQLYKEILNKTHEVNKKVADSFEKMGIVFKDFGYDNFYYDVAGDCDPVNDCFILVIKYERYHNIRELFDIFPKDIANIIQDMCKETYYLEFITRYCTSCDGGDYEENVIDESIEGLLDFLTVHVDRDEFLGYIKMYCYDDNLFEKWVLKNI